MKKEKRSKRRKQIPTGFIVLIFFIGLGVLLYPSVSSWWNSKVQSTVVATYDESVASMSTADYSAYFEAAEAYNAALAELGSASALTEPDLVEGYEDLLDVTGTGVMGYITIEKINVELPIYHGTSSAVLAAGAGHLEGSSLPVGGESTHCVISAHRGLPSSTLFTNLDQLEVGDTFTITVLDQIFTYEVDLITIVLPTETENLYIEEGKDYCTLMTCTPYGINTHRLLVRGHRVDNASTSHIRVIAEAYKVDSIIVAPVVAVPLLLLLLIWLLVSTSRTGRKRRADRKARLDESSDKV